MKEVFKSPIFKYVVLAVAGFAVYKLMKNFFGDKLTPQKAETEISELLAADTSQQVQGTATISSVEASQIATRIKNAWGVMNDDEEAVYTAFRKLHNLADLFLIIEKYGYYQPNILIQKEDLPTSITKRLTSKEVEKINKILSERGINYAF